MKKFKEIMEGKAIAAQLKAKSFTKEAIEALKNPFNNNLALGDTDEATAGAKGIRWGTFAFLAMIVIGLLVFVWAAIQFFEGKFKGSFDSLKGLFS